MQVDHHADVSSSDDDDTNLPWDELYKPQTLDEIVGNELTLHQIKSFENSTIRIPPLIITGKPGRGKSKTVECFVKTLYNAYMARSQKRAATLQQHLMTFEEFVMFRNVSMDRAQLVNYTMPFCTRNSTEWPGEVRYVVLSEVDKLPEELELQMLNLIASFTKTVRFILICNDIEKLPASFQKECVKLVFQSLSPLDTMTYLRRVCDRRQLSLQEIEPVLQAIAHQSDGDARQAILLLQNTCNMARVSGRTVPTLQDLELTSPAPLTHQVQKILSCCGGFGGISMAKYDVFKAQEMLDMFWRRGNSALLIVKTIAQVISNMKNQINCCSEDLTVQRSLHLEQWLSIANRCMHVLEVRKTTPGHGSAIQKMQLDSLVAQFCLVYERLYPQQ